MKHQPAITGRPKKGNKKLRMEVIHGGKVVPKDQAPALLISVSDRYHARRLQGRLERTIKRHQHSPERQSVAIAMLAVERAIVEAFWVLGRSTSDPVPQLRRQHGIDYPIEREDKWSAAVASGGWLTDPPAPSPPTAAEIDGMHGPLEWLQLLDEQQRAIVSAGTRSKRGDVAVRVNWFRVKLQYPNLGEWTTDRLSRMYNEGLRIIAVEIGLA